MSTVHVVLATYNGEKYLREQLDSILEGDYDDISIEICDDGSTDATVKIANEYVLKYQDTVFLYQNKKKLGYQRNFLEGIKRSTSPYIMLCDQDDIWMKGKISITLEKVRTIETEQKDMPVLVFTDAILYDNEQKIEIGSFHKGSHLNPEKVDISHLLMENKVIGCTVMVNKNILPFLEILPKEIRVHDWWLALICSAFGQIGYIKQGTLLYRQHRGNIIGGTSFFQYIKKRIVSLEQQKAALAETYAQAGAFYRLFEKKLESDTSYKVRQFKEFSEIGFWRKRIRCLKHGYLKTGIMRNAALMLIV